MMWLSGRRNHGKKFLISSFHCQHPRCTSMTRMENVREQEFSPPFHHKYHPLSHSLGSMGSGMTPLALVRLHGQWIDPSLSLVRLHGQWIDRSLTRQASSAMDRPLSLTRQAVLAVDRPLSHSSGSMGSGSIPLSHSSGTVGNGSIPLSHSSGTSHSHSPGPTTSCESLSHYQYDHIQTPNVISFDEDQQHLKTKLAEVFSKVLGTDETIKRFDSIRYVIKTTKQERKVSLAQAREHEQLKIQIHTNAIERKETLKQELKSYKYKYFHRHGLLPQDTDEEYKSLIKQGHNIKWLLSTWATTCT